MSVTRSSQKTTIIIYQELSKHCHTGENGVAVYEDGWNDERVHKMLEANNPDVPFTLKMVTGLRLKMFGRINTNRQEGLESRIADLEAIVKHMQQELSNMTNGRYRPPVGRPRSTPPE